MQTETRQLDEPDPAPDDADWLVGQTFDRFVVRRVVGRGGMGLVVEAHDPGLDRLVALKLVLDRRASSSAGQRLVREARAMARLSHPNVVQVHEVGTVDGQVFIVMELVRGQTLAQWLATRPTQAEILAAFAAAAAALHAAHRTGLVHRDFKPSNVLVDDDGRVRVTDFGIALQLAAEPELDDGTDDPIDAVGGKRRLADLTRTGAAIGTPRYMAPEQRDGGEVTPRSDQYAFCVALWEALFGDHPFVNHEVTTRSGGPSASADRPNAQTTRAGSARIDPPPVAEAAREVAGEPTAKRPNVPKWLRRVVVRGLAADPAKRHPSMAAISAALARDPARRGRRIAAWGVVTAMVVAAAVVAVGLRPDASGACVAAGGERADALWNPLRRVQLTAAFAASGRPHAATSSERAAAAIDGWQRAWRAGYVDACEATRVRDAQSEVLLDRRLACLDRRLADARATVELLIAGGGDAVDHAIEAATSLPTAAACADADALLAGVPPPDDTATRVTVAAVRMRLDEARGLRRLGRFQAGLDHARGALAAATATRYRPVEAEALLVAGQLLVDTTDKTASATLRSAMHAAAEVSDQRLVVDAAAWLVIAMARTSEPYAQALEVAELAEAIGRHARPPAEVVVRLVGAIGQTHLVHGKPALARARFEEALALAERGLGPDDPAVSSVLEQLGNVATTQGRFADAQLVLERVVASRRRVFGDHHPELADALNNLGNVYRMQGKLADAKSLYDRALAIRIAALGPDHRSVAASYNSLAALDMEQGDAAKAVEHYGRALATWEKIRDPDHADIGKALTNLANAEDSRGNLARARELGERALRILEAVHGPDHPLIAHAASNLGIVATDQGRLDDALRLFERARQITDRVHGPDHPDVADYLANAASVLQQQGKLHGAEAMLGRSLVVVAKAYGADHPRMASGLVNLANLQLARRDARGALESARRSLEILEAKLGADHPNASYAHLVIGGALQLLGRANEAVPHLERALAVREAAKLPPALVAEGRFTLAKGLVAAGRDRARAVQLATQAAAAYTAAGRGELAAEVRSWLARR